MEKQPRTSSWLQRKLAKLPKTEALPRMGKKERVNHWLRRVLDEETDRIVSSWNTGSLDAIEISGTAWRKAGFRSYLSLQYPEFDVCEPTDKWSDRIRKVTIETADVVLAEQVWEHLRYPYRAGKNVVSMLRPGGLFLITTPFLLRVHGVDQYSDCSRWTAEGMRYFLEECGFDPNTIETYSWGNKECAAAHVQNEIWFEYQEGMNLADDPIYPCVVWGIARKKLS